VRWPFVLPLLILVTCKAADDVSSDTAGIPESVSTPVAAPMGSKSASVEESPLQPPPAASRFALLVAIDTYPKPEHTLPSPTQDVASVEAVLRDRYGFPQSNIRVLRNHAATRDAIIGAFQSHLSRAGADGVAFFYFVGHGLLLDRDYSVAEGENDQGLFVWKDATAGTVILDDELSSLASDLSAGRRVVVLDACYSAAAGDTGPWWLPIQRAMSKRMSQVFGDDHEPPPVPVVMNAGPNRAGDPAEIPANFISDGRMMTPINSMPLVLFAATAADKPAYSIANWPKYPRSRAVFSHYFDDALGKARPTDTFEDLFVAISRGMSSPQGCIANKKDCQKPQLLGGLRSQSVESVLGRR
jgi:hypothetical protein